MKIGVHFLSLLFGLFASVSASAAPLQQEGDEPLRYATLERSAELRNLPDADGVAVYTAEANTLLAVYRERAGWLEVEIPGGFPTWIFGRYLRPTESPDIYEVTNNGVNLRPRPNKAVGNFPVSGRLHAGDRVQAITRQDETQPLAADWVRIWSAPGIRAWVPEDDARPVQGGKTKWAQALQGLTRSAPPVPAASGPANAPATAKTTEVAAPEAGDGEALAARALEETRILLAEQRRSAAPNFAGVREGYMRVLSIAPSGTAAQMARQGLETVDALEAAGSLKAELEAERQRRERELHDRQEEIWEKSRAKDPNLGRFDARGVLEKRQAAGEEPRFWLRWGGQDVHLVTCANERYDLGLFAGFEVGLVGQATPAEEGAGPAPLDVARLVVLSRR